MSKKQMYLSIAFNALIFLLECYVLSNAYFGYVRNAKGEGGQGAMMFHFFTEDSNLLLGISSLLYLIFVSRSLKGKAMPNWVKVFRLVAVTAVTTTFLVVLLFLAPAVVIVYHYSYFSMFGFPNTFFTHFVCPLLAIASHLFFEEPLEKKKPDWQMAFFCLITVVLYAIIIGTLASLHLVSSDEQVNNVYGFMDITVNWWASLIAIITIIGGTYGEGILLLKGQRRIQKKSPANPA
jgi:hypothetical protein